MRTSFHHQPEAQHPHSPAINTPAGRLPHLWVDVVEKVGDLRCAALFLSHWPSDLTRSPALRDRTGGCKDALDAYAAQ